MKTRYYTSLCLFAAVALLVTGCFEEEIQSYDGPPQIGFEFQGSEATVWDGSGSHSATVMLIAPHLPEDVRAQVGVDANATDASSGNYSFDDVVTISSNSSSTDFVVDIHDAELTPGDTRTVVFELQEALTSGVVLAENLRTHTVFINARRAIVETDGEEYDFGAADPDEGEEVTLTITISNDGNRESELSDFTIEGDDADLFSHDAEDTGLAAGGDYEVDVTFAPNEEGEFEATFTFMWTMGVGAPDGAEYSVSLTGVGAVDDGGGNGGE